MSAASGISASQELLDEYAKAMEPGGNVRFLKIGIQDERLVPHGSWPIESRDMASDFTKLKEILEDNVPAYMLAKLDGTAGWLFISYVPDTAKVRDKMLYASSRSAVVKALGGQAFADTMFTTSKSDLTPSAYAAHLRHIAAPHPMSPREQELADIKAAEKEMGEAYEGSRARKSHVGSGVGLKWSSEVEVAVKAAVSGEGEENLVIIGLDLASETLTLTATKTVDPSTLANSLPPSEPSYAFYRWQEGKIIFIYACPSSSKIKLRMIYSSGVSGVIQTAQDLASFKVFRKLETSDPADLDISFDESSAPPPSGQGTGPPSFARPRGPPRKR